MQRGRLCVLPLHHMQVFCHTPTGYPRLSTTATLQRDVPRPLVPTTRILARGHTGHHLANLPHASTTQDGPPDRPWRTPRTDGYATSQVTGMLNLTPVPAHQHPLRNARDTTKTHHICTKRLGCYANAPRTTLPPDKNGGAQTTYTWRTRSINRQH